MSITQFLALASISFLTACSLALVESEELQVQAWDLALEAQDLAGVQWLETTSSDGPDAEVEQLDAAGSKGGIADSIDEPSLADKARHFKNPAVKDDPTAEAARKEIEEIEALIAPLVIQERLLTRELGDGDVEVELTREEIGILKAELGEAEARLEAWQRSEQLKQVAHIRDAASHLREAGLTQLADALDEQLRAYESETLPAVSLPTAQEADLDAEPTSEIDALREEISRLRKDVNQLKQR